MNTGNKTPKTPKTYAIDRRIVGSYFDHNARTTPLDYWTEVCQLQATRTGKALRIAARKWAGQLRARLINQNQNQGS